MIDEPLVLPEGVVVFPVEELASSVQARLRTRAGQYALTNRAGRSPTVLVSAETAALIELFREPRSVAAAVKGFSEANASDAHLVLDDSFPTLRELVFRGFLIRASSDPGPGLPERIEDLTVTHCIQCLPDVAVLRACTSAGVAVAVKLIRDPHDSAGRAALAREAAVLELARNCHVPSLVRDGSSHDQPFIATGWVSGAIVTEYAARRRKPWDPGWRVAATQLAFALLDAYAGLHERGIVHADVHPKNVVVAADGKVTLIDFGLARVPDDPALSQIRRGGVLAYYEPEWALARLRRRPPPEATALSDQHGLGALLYQIFTGRHYVDAMADAGELLARIASENPSPFGEHGVPPWPAVEAVLARMLARSPAERFRSVADAAEALRSARPQPSDRRRLDGGGAVARLLETTTHRLSRDGGLIDRGLPSAPRASVNYGAAGVAYFFYRLALASSNAQHLARALRWIGWARRHGDDELAFHDRELGIRPDRVGRVSIYHSAAGTACVEALVANACGDGRRAGQAAVAFVAASRLHCASADLTIGRASTVLGATLLWEALAGTGIGDRCGLLALGDETLAGLLSGLPRAVNDESAFRLRGIAHGWAGVLYAALRWCEATGAGTPAVVVDRIEELAALGRVTGGSVSWNGPHDMPRAGGWCHGPAGFTHLWSTAARALGDSAHANRALEAAEASWAHPELIATLCCGSAGQAYAMLIAHELSGEPRWLRRAHRLAARASREAGTRWCVPNSLWKGDVGIALLAADLEHPVSSCMPLFGREGWPSPATQDELRAIPGLA